MSKTLIGTMSTIGFITDDQLELAADRHLTYWFACRRNQNRLLDPNSSFEYLLSDYQGNKDSLVANFKISIESYFKKVFDSVNVEVQTPEYTDTPGNFTLEFSLSITNDGRSIDLLNSVLISGESYKLVKEGRLNGK